MRKYKIIIVENDEDEQVFMKEGFDKTDHFNILALLQNGNDLFDWLHENPNQLPDLILSDLNMPGKNGYDVITEVKETPHIAHIPVIITSTSSTPSIIEKCLQMGAAYYMVKPETFVQYEPYVQQLYKVLVDNKIVDKAV